MISVLMIVSVYIPITSYAQSNILDLGISEVIREALAKVEGENDIMKSRFMSGMDKHVRDFQTIEPVLFSESPLDIGSIGRHCEVINWIARLIRDRGLTLTTDEILRHPTASNVSCPFLQPIECLQNSPYRTVDGTCNNPQNPRLGAGFTPFSRDLHPVYELDASGMPDLPRTKSRDGSDLPGSRFISTRFHLTNDSLNSDSNLTFIFSIWGQFLAHDVTDRAPGKGFRQSSLDCCSQTLPTKTCFNIDVPNDDIFRGLGRECLSFPRSAAVTDMNCQSGLRQQLNQASSFIDASSVYGQTTDKFQFLRKFSSGELIMSQPNHLPYKSHPNSLGEKQGFASMQSGDDRVTVFPGLIGIETLWFRKHNLVARQLKLINSSWDDEALFQEARRVIIAIIQHITYGEWLPLLLGPQMMRKYELSLLSTGYFTDYNPSIDPSTSNEVATAAFRFGHSAVRSSFSLLDRSFLATSEPRFVLEDSFFKPNLYLMHEQQFMRGTLVDRSKTINRAVTSSLVNKLYQTRPGNGLDLAAFNIQRGRDHGLPPYNSWRRLFRLSEAEEFSANTSIGFEDIPSESVNLLQRLYSHPDDVDLWVGGVSEAPLQGAMLGPLFSNMMGRQFWKYKHGDRFWYETGTAPQAFTIAQLNEIRKMTLAQVMCDTLDLDSIQPRAFEKYTEIGNSRVSCTQVPDMDFTKWN